MLQDSNQRAAHGMVHATLGHLRSSEHSRISKSLIKAVLVSRVSEWSEQQKKTFFGIRAGIVFFSAPCSAGSPTWFACFTRFL
jgi:hypothetical protein